MTTRSIHAVRAGLLALATVMACASVAAQDSPGASKGFDHLNRRNGMADHEAYQRYDDQRRYSRQEQAQRDRAERRRIEKERQRADRERRRYPHPGAGQQNRGLDGLNRGRDGEMHSGGS